MPAKLPLSRPIPKTTATSASTTTTTPTTRTSHTHLPSAYLYIHLTYHASHISHPVDEITLRQALTAALRQHHGQHGAAVPIDILSTWIASSSAARAAGSDDRATHMILRTPREDGSAVVGACGAWIGAAAGGKGASAGGGEQEERRTGWIVRGWDGALGRLALGVDGGGQALFTG